MVTVHDVDEDAPWRNDPLATRAVKIVREYHIGARKGTESIKQRQLSVIDYGMLLLEVRRQHTSHKKYNEEVLARRLDLPPFDDRRHRTAALTIAESIDWLAIDNTKTVDLSPVNNREKALDGCKAETAPEMVRWARKTGLIPRKKHNPEVTVQARNRVRLAVKNGEPVSRNQIAEELGTHNSTVDVAIGLERGRLEGIVEGEALALNEQGKFPKVQAKHIEALIKKYRRDLDAQFAAAVATEVDKQVKARKASLERAQEACAKQKNDAYKDQQYWKKLINNHKPPLTKSEYIDIQWVLRNREPPQERRDRATVVFEDKKLQLTGEK